MARLYFLLTVVLQMSFLHISITDGDPSKHIPSKKLGESCAKATDCKSAFSSCLKGKCSCNEGFKPQGDYMCKAATYSCPSGDPLRQKGLIVPCKHVVASMPLNPSSTGPRLFRRDSEQQSCPEAYYCHVYERSGAVGSGHCCPVPTNVCPAGLPDSTMICGPTTKGQSACDPASHQCIPVVTGDGETIANLCCPRPCAEGLFYLEGKCLGRVAIGDDCESNQQCGGDGSGLCQKGKCVCPEGKVPDDTNSCVVPTCPSDDAKSEKKEVGKIQVCSKSGSKCGSNAYCHSTMKICCPIPTPYCPQTQSTPSLKDRCVLTNTDEKTKECGKEFHCQFWYNSINSTGHGVSNGLCCPGADVATTSSLDLEVGDGK